MRIDISLRGITVEEMYDWAAKADEFREKRHTIRYSIKYGDDWEGEKNETQE